MESKWSDGYWEVSDHREEESEVSLRSLINYRSATYAGHSVVENHREEEPEHSLWILVNYRSAPYTGQQVVRTTNNSTAPYYISKEKLPKCGHVGLSDEYL
ncbi:hypothetical protein AVEN_238113-1 [Araneus ventricosus]|uniref:Uncharacterized protein n=1 Tax=Araneus ventricosus TaxID=182803 RepID=A0A4Y2NDF0_ARAVE|nr:hypothetical protein AVEN_238113-1 [Araneus ventricosus]